MRGPGQGVVPLMALSAVARLTVSAHCGRRYARQDPFLSIGASDLNDGVIMLVGLGWTSAL